MHQVRYIAIARIADKTSVAEHSFVEAEEVPKNVFDEKLSRLLASGRVNQHGRLTITDDDVGSIHFDSDPACLYLVITAQQYPQRVAFRLLNQLRTDFEELYSNEFNKARESSLTKKTKQMCSDLAQRFENAGETDKIASVALQVEEVKGAMQQNINAVLKNQENLETLLESSTNMRSDAATFQRSAVQVKNRMWWKNVKLLIAICLVLFILVGAVVIPTIVKRSKTSGTAPYTSG